MQLIVHAPLGARINRALGLGLRKKFCLTFDFELQAAASNDAVLLSLGPQHSFPLEDVPAFLRSHNVQDAVSQAVLRSPMFTARWRWNLNRSLAVLRRKGGRRQSVQHPADGGGRPDGRRVPVARRLPGQRPGRSDRDPRSPARARDAGRLPDRGDGHRGPQGAGAPVRAGHRSAAFRRHGRAQRARPRDPERRAVHLSRRGHRDRRAPVAAVPLRRGLPVEPRELGRLDPDAIERVRAEATPEVRDRRRAPRRAPVARRRAARGRNGPSTSRLWPAKADAFEVHVPGNDRRHCGGRPSAVAELEALFPGARFAPDHQLPLGLAAELDARGRRRRRGDRRPGSSRGLRSGHASRNSRTRPGCRRRSVGHRARGAPRARVRGQPVGSSPSGASSGAPAGCWRASTPTRGSAGAPRSARSPRRSGRAFLESLVARRSRDAASTGGPGWPR